MRNISSTFAIMFLLLLGACSWFEESQPLPAELPRRTPVANSSKKTPNLPTQSSGFSGGFPGASPFSAAPPIPAPPAFIGSAPVASAQPSAQTSAFALPTSSPVNLSAAQSTAVGLPIQRRAPAFNQANLSAPSVAQAAPTIPPLPQIGSINPAQTQIPSLPQFTAISPAQVQIPQAPAIAKLPEFGNNGNVPNEFPKLAQIPSAPQISAVPDQRIANLKADLASQNADFSPKAFPSASVAKTDISPATNFASLRPLGNEPINKIPVEPAFQQLKPLPNQPIYKLEETPIVQQPSVQPRRPVSAPSPSTPAQYAASANITNLQNLRPISRGSSVRRSTLKPGEVARHSTRYGY